MRADLTPRHGHVIVDGLRLHYLAWGDPANPPMLLLHGVGQQAHSWDFVAMDLGQDHYVISLDQRGHGESDWAPDRDYSPEAFQRDLDGVVDHLGLKQFVLVGLSMGGMNAIRFAARRQHELRGLVVVDIGPEVIERGGREIRAFMEMDDELDTFEEFVERAARFNPLRPKESFRGSLQHNLKQLPSGKWTWKYDKYFRDPTVERKRPDLWPDVRQLRLPVLVVRGEYSHVLGEEQARVFVEALPDASYVVIPGAGHLVPGDQPDRFSDALRAWLRTRRPEGIR
ncbi:MAG: alpha/beta hydrolase [Chloroflexota bacterium]|nr:alpha/beta hydrolase [Dehalococcoidia bacterium]MDW8252742.1 alpha/beta hydrolase [Chloroflexota bacterium]